MPNTSHNAPPANAWVITGPTSGIGHRTALELAKQWAVDRVQFGQQIGKFQGVSFKLADIAVELREGWSQWDYNDFFSTSWLTLKGGRIDDAARTVFTRGHCHSLALAIQQARCKKKLVQIRPRRR